MTLYGESGGGAGVMLHALAYSGTKETDPFHRIIGQSAAARVGEIEHTKSASEALLAQLGVKSVDEARQLPTEALVKANAIVERVMPYFGECPAEYRLLKL